MGPSASLGACPRRPRRRCVARPCSTATSRRRQARRLRRLGDAGPVRGRARRAPRGARARAGSSTSRTWARSRPAGPARSSCCSGCSPTTSRRSAPLQAARSTRCSAARTAACSTTCSPTASDLERYLTVTNAANHERDLAWFSAHAAELADVAGQRPRSRTGRCSPCRGRSRARSCRRSPTAPLPARMSAAPRRLAGAEVIVCGTGYTGEDGVELLCAPADAPALWDEIVRRGAVPAGLGARDTLRLEVCFHLYGNDLSVERGPIEAGLGWCCKEDTGFIGAEAVRAVRERGPAEQLVAFAIDGPGDRAPGQPGARAAAWSRAARSRRACRRASGWPTCRPSGPRAAPAWRSTFVARCAPPSSRTSRSTERTREWRRPATPTELLYHPEHDWARIDEADPEPRRSGITWYAQDALGEVVFFEPPARRHDAAARTRPTPRSSRSRPSPTSSRRSPARSSRSTRSLAENPGMINEDPYGEGWLVKVRLSDPAEREALLDAASYMRHAGWLGCTAVEPLHRHHPRGPRRDARGDRRRLARGALRAPDPRGGAPRPRARAARRAAPSRTSTSTCARWPRATRAPRTSSASSAPACTTTTCPR